MVRSLDEGESRNLDLGRNGVLKRQCDYVVQFLIFSLRTCSLHQYKPNRLLTMGRELPSPHSPQEQARKLIEQKSAIEAELQVHFSILKANDVTMETPLVDREGFPRADIDIYAVRGTRKRIIELRNDLKAVMDEIQQALETIYAVPPPGEGSSSPMQDVEEITVQPKPFAKVDGVAPGSPANDAVGISSLRGLSWVQLFLVGLVARGPHCQVWWPDSEIIFIWIHATACKPCFIERECGSLSHAKDAVLNSSTATHCNRYLAFWRK